MKEKAARRGPSIDRIGEALELDSLLVEYENPKSLIPSVSMAAAWGLS